MREFRKKFLDCGPLHACILISLLLHASALLWLIPAIVRPAATIHPEPRTISVTLLSASRIAPAPNRPVALPRAVSAIPKKAPDTVPPAKPKNNNQARTKADQPVEKYPGQRENQTPEAPTESPRITSTSKSTAEPIAPPTATVTDTAATSTPEPRDPASDWQQAFSSLLAQRKRYPAKARRMRLQGKVVIDASFSPQGALTAASIATGSGYDSLDEAALQLVREAADAARHLASPGIAIHRSIPVIYALDGGK